MGRSEKDQYIINRYQQDEEMMILIFAQWCINHELDAVALYQEAYPNQAVNSALLKAMEQTVTKEESEEIPDALLQQALQLYGNDDLAFVVQEKINARK